MIVSYVPGSSRQVEAVGESYRQITMMIQDCGGIQRIRNRLSVACFSLTLRESPLLNGVVVERAIEVPDCFAVIRNPDEMPRDTVGNSIFMAHRVPFYRHLCLLQWRWIQRQKEKEAQVLGTSSYAFHQLVL